MSIQKGCGLLSYLVLIHYNFHLDFLNSLFKFSPFLFFHMYVHRIKTISF